MMPSESAKAIGRKLHFPEHELDLSRAPLIMGVLNVTPDSFSDGGDYFQTSEAIGRGVKLARDGADILDIGGESTRPDAEPVDDAEQIRRVVPVIQALREKISIPISIDTTSAQVAAAALQGGAEMINDISALRFDPDMAAVAKQYQAPIALMHMRGRPRTMQKNPAYTDVVREIKIFLQERIDFALSQGIDRSKLIVDPGIGFGKTVEHNLQILRRLAEFNELGVPVLLGPSRKSFIGVTLELPDPADRIFGTAAVIAWCVPAETAILRVHDVLEMKQVVQMIRAIQNSD